MCDQVFAAIACRPALDPAGHIPRYLQSVQGARHSRNGWCQRPTTFRRRAATTISAVTLTREQTIMHGAPSWTGSPRENDLPENGTVASGFDPASLASPIGQFEQQSSMVRWLRLAGRHLQ
jgi:hypothetical protein